MTSYTFDQLLDFTRTSSATFVGSNGLVQTTPASRNLLTFTQEFDNAAWAKTNMTVTANSTTAPDGTSTADTLTATAGTAISVRVSQSGTTINATIYNTSFYVRPGTHTFVQIHINAQTADWCNFTLTGSGSVQNNGAAVGTISFDSATGYYRISITYTAGGTDRTPFFGLVPSGTATRNQTWNPVGTETVFIWGAQLEAASAATTYTRNNGGVFPPRFDYDPVTLAAKGLLIEEQRTNLVTYSEQFDNASWTKSGATATANATASPDGTSNADKIVENTATSGHGVSTAANVTLAANTAATFSLYVKPDGRNARITIYTASNGLRGTFNFSTLTVTNGSYGNSTYTSGTISAVGNGWYRIVLAGIPSSTEANPTLAIEMLDGTTLSYTGNGTSGLFLYGAQIEAGAFATSYIPTVASQVTRTADQTSIVAPNFASWYNQSEGSFVVEFDQNAVSSEIGYVGEVRTDNNNRIQLFANNGAGQTQLTVRNGGVLQADLSTTGSITQGAVVKAAYAYKSSDFAAVRGGGTVVTGLTGTVPTVTSLLVGFSQVASNLELNGHIRSVRYYPTRLTNAQLQALTA